MPTPRRCALYLRSSKDRNDVSPDAQRKILNALAGRLDVTIAQEFVDVEISGKTAARPGFIALTEAIKDPARGWSVVMMIDFERLARNRHLASGFEFECSQHGCDVVYANMPESNPLTDMVIRPLMHGFAEYKSWEAKMKGLAGMRENVARGFRAGGRAPFGYALEHVDTGAMREGKPVLKSRLVLAETAATIATYLKGRAEGRKGTGLARQLGLELARATLTGIERNALTYAGHTVWNVHNEAGPGGYKGGGKRRPRSEWVIQRNTHVALITDDEAERILEQLDRSPHAGKRSRSTTSANLLSGILVTSKGEQWHADRGGRAYRFGTRTVSATHVDRCVLAGVGRDLASERFVRALIDRIQAAAAAEVDGRALAACQRELADRERRLERLTQLLADTDAPGPLLRSMERLEAERQALADKLATGHQKARQAREAAKITPEAIRRCAQRLMAHVEAGDPARLKEFLRGVVPRVELDPGRATARICYQLPGQVRDSVASPGRPGGNPHVMPHSTISIFIRRGPAGSLRKAA